MKKTRQTLIKTKEREEEKENMMISVIISFFAVIIAFAALVVQYHYSSSEYKYKIDPTFDLHFSMKVTTEVVDGERIATPNIGKISIHNAELNNLARLYIISPDYTTVEIDTENIKNNIEDYFNKAVSIPENYIIYGDNTYFYRFVVYESLSDEIDIDVFYFKTSKLTKENKNAIIEFQKLDLIQLLEFEKGHIGDDNYIGERKIVEQYKEIRDFYDEVNNNMIK